MKNFAQEFYKNGWVRCTGKVAFSGALGNKKSELVCEAKSCLDVGEQMRGPQTWHVCEAQFLKLVLGESKFAHQWQGGSQRLSGGAGGWHAAGLLLLR